MQARAIHHLTVGGLAAHCWIYPLEQTSGLAPCALIDPGADGSRIIARLDQLNLFPAYIVLTHGHFDHTGALPVLAAEYGKRRITFETAIHTADAEYLGPDSYQLHCRSFKAAAGSSTYVEYMWEGLPSADRLLVEGDRIGPFTVLHLPGHTPGSIGLWDSEDGCLFSGDTLFCDGYGRTDLPGGNEAQLYAGLRRLFAMDGGIRVYPGHGPPTSIQRERTRFMGTELC